MKRWINFGIILALLLPATVWAQDATPEATDWVLYEDQDGVFSLQHPAEWLSELPEGLVGVRLANNADALTRSNANESLETGDLAVQALFLPRAMFNNISNVNIPTEAPADELAQLFADLLFGSQTDEITGDPIYEMGEPELVELAELKVGVMSLLNTDIEVEIFWIVYEASPDLFILFAGLTPQDELTEDVQTLYLDIVNSLSVQAEADEVFQILLELQ